MAYTEPPTIVASTTATADDANIWSEDIRYLKAGLDGLTFSGVQAYRNANQSLTTATETEVSFDTETVDVGGWFDGSDTDIIVPAGAIPSGFTTIACDVTVRARFASNATGYRRISILVNDVATCRTSVDALSGAETEVIATDIIFVGSGDVITVKAYQSSGGALDLEVPTITVARRAPVS